MTNSQKNAAIVNLAAADRAASTRPHEEANNSIGACPARQSQIFVVPVRYALSEEAASHEAYKPGVTPQSHAMAARRLRKASFTYGNVMGRSRNSVFLYKASLKKMTRIKTRLSTDKAVRQDFT